MLPECRVIINLDFYYNYSKLITVECLLATLPVYSAIILVSTLIVESMLNLPAATGFSGVRSLIQPFGNKTVSHSVNISGDFSYLPIYYFTNFIWLNLDLVLVVADSYLFVFSWMVFSLSLLILHLMRVYSLLIIYFTTGSEALEIFWDVWTQPFLTQQHLRH